MINTFITKYLHVFIIISLDNIFRNKTDDFYLFIIHVWSCPSSRFSWTFYCLQDKALTTWCGVKVRQYLTYLFNLMFYHSPPFTTLAILQIYSALLLIRLFTCDVSSIKDTFFPSLCTVKFYSSFKTLLGWALCCEVLCDLSRKHFSLLCYYSSFVIAFNTCLSPPLGWEILENCCLNSST